MSSLKVTKAYDVFTGRPLSFAPHDGGIAVTGLDRKASPADTILAVVYDQPIRNVWNN